MPYHITGNTDVGAVCLKRDSLEGALKKARELREDGTYLNVRIVDAESGATVPEPEPQYG